MDLAKMLTRGEGVKNPENCVDVIYVWPLTQFSPNLARNPGILSVQYFSLEHGKC